MEEIVETIIEEAKRHFAEKILPYLKEQGEKLFVNLKKELVPVLKDFLGKIQKANSSNVVYKIVPTLDKELLIEMAGKHIVPGSNQVVAIKDIKDNKTFIYLAYAKNRELLDEKCNKFIVLESDDIDESVVELFENESLLILE